MARIYNQFLSTPSARRATNSLHPLKRYLVISIHALREEGDIVHFVQVLPEDNFYPRPPRGGRLEPVHMAMVNGQFLSTPSARRATSSPWSTSTST